MSQIWGRGHLSKDCLQGGGGGSRACHECHEAGHTSKGCPNLFSELTEDGKPREQYILEAVIYDEKELNKGIICGERFNNFVKVVLQITGKDVPQYLTPFEEAGLCQLLNQHLFRKLQLQASYLVPVLNILLEQGVAGASHAMGQKPEVVIVAPTRELAIQIHREACKFSCSSVLKFVIIYGGTVTSHQRSNLQAGCNILVATAGRFKDFLDGGVFDFSGVRF
ncbi:probable ATP-dependent RNA helicase vasa-like [Daphnia carinata]|uniref:probable ATP-dependent RNA helicase vasa-like n=1 Tax=Daphnia carinata TaxID=120202 RepID=UPI00286855DD|nr:probable ATP-dependent RNA helicase vasa-like [Daphnia carinata]XP_059353287.1 probable ATP-dependent RNA helicase vasa-like [Daphnia carinata]